MKFGISLIVRGPEATAETFVALAELAEQQQWDCLWTSDHLVLPPLKTTRYPGSASGALPDAWKEAYFQPFSVLNFLAGRTRTVRLGTSVLIVPMRNPLEVAAQVAELDQLSGGRMNFGIGVGWFREEIEALGYTFADRGSRTDEALSAMQALWRDAPASFDGEHYRFEALDMGPKPKQRPHPPIYIGGNGRAALARVARYGDVWHPFRATPEQIASGYAALGEALAAADRDVTSLPVAAKIPLTFQEGPAAEGQLPSQGRPRDIVDALKRYIDAGVTEFCFDFAPETLATARDTMSRFVQEVRPQLR